MRHFIQKLYRKLNPAIKFNKTEALYYRKVGKFIIYSNDISSITSTYGSIFLKGSYTFPAAENPIIIDAGANIGMGILYWKTIYPSSRIYSFEPSKEVFKVLNKNIQVNKLDNVSCFNLALSDKDGYFEFTADEGVSGSLTLEKNLHKTYKVQATKLSPYLKELGLVDFLKIDIEGSELNVVSEISNQLSKVKYMFIEYHSFIHKQQDLSELLKILEVNNFRYHIDGEYHLTKPLFNKLNSKGQDLQIGIWARNLTLVS